MTPNRFAKEKGRTLRGASSSGRRNAELLMVNPGDPVRAMIAVGWFVAEAPSESVGKWFPRPLIEESSLLQSDPHANPRAL
jgi:hypothetical protein